MLRSERFWDRLEEASDLEEAQLHRQSLVEIVGCRRVLIEQHCGVKAYSREKIIVRMKYGDLHICGDCLEFGRMSREQLIIRGEIVSVTLQRG